MGSDLRERGQKMGSAAKRADAAFWVDGSTVRAIALPELSFLDSSEAGVIEFPPLRGDTIAIPQSNPIALVEILQRFERQISYATIVLAAVILAAISVSATSAGITMRDLSVNIENLRSQTSILERELENAKRTPPESLASPAKMIIPLDSGNVIYVPLPKAR